MMPPVQIAASTPCLSPTLRGVLADTVADTLEMNLRFTPAEKRVLKKKRPIPPSAWAQKHRVVTMSALPGPWRNDVTPYLTAIMDVPALPYVREVIVCKSPQVGVSEAAHNFVGWAIDRAAGPVLYIYPDRDTARENSQDRIQPMLTSSVTLREYVTGSDDDMTNMRINLSHMPIYLAWATSAARLANKPIRYLIFDEIDKYPETARKTETDPISLGMKRSLTYGEFYRAWKISTPTIETGSVWMALTTEAQVVFDYETVCPFCDTRQVMAFENIKWPRRSDKKKSHPKPETVKTEKLAWYECPECTAEWSDDDRNRAVAKGRWVERKTGREIYASLQDRRPAKVGFHLPAWISPFVSLSDCAAAFIAGLTDKTKLRDFMNNYAAKPWVVYEKTRSEDVILELRDDRAEMTVPGDGKVARLIWGADTQDYGIWYWIVGVGWGETAPLWDIVHGYVPSRRKDDFSALEEVLFKRAYKTPAGVAYPVHDGVIDVGGHRATQVLNFCRKHPGKAFPIRGAGRNQARHRAWRKVDTYPGTSRPYPGGLWRLDINDHVYKDDVAGMLQIHQNDPGALVLNANAGQDMAAQLCAEELDPEKGWINPRQRPNHLFDILAYLLAWIEERKLRYLPKPEKAKPKPKPPPSPPVRGRGVGRPSPSWRG